MFMESTIGSPTGFGRRGNDTDSEMEAVEDDPPERRSNVSVVDVDTCGSVQSAGESEGAEEDAEGEGANT
jgi:hypothetical protein